MAVPEPRRTVCMDVLSSGVIFTPQNPRLDIIHVRYEASQIPLERMRGGAQIQFMGSAGVNGTLATHDLNTQLASYFGHTETCRIRYQSRGRLQVRKTRRYMLHLVRSHLPWRVRLLGNVPITTGRLLRSTYTRFVRDLVYASASTIPSIMRLGSRPILRSKGETADGTRHE
jgi:hypothetical protein